MSPEIIADALAFLERVQLVGKEVPAFNRVVASLLWERDLLMKKKDILPKEKKPQN